MNLVLGCAKAGRVPLLPKLGHLDLVPPGIVIEHGVDVLGRRQPLHAREDRYGIDHLRIQVIALALPVGGYPLGGSELDRPHLFPLHSRPLCRPPRCVHSASSLCGGMGITAAPLAAREKEPSGEKKSCAPRGVVSDSRGTMFSPPTA